ncbi:MAG: DUF4912 domain-containing protein [Pirellulaceae bacterium]
MITSGDLKNQTKADLAQMATRLGIASVGSMRKEELIEAITNSSKSKAQKAKSTTRKALPSSGTAKKSPRKAKKAAPQKSVVANKTVAAKKKTASTSPKATKKNTKTAVQTASKNPLANTPKKPIKPTKPTAGKKSTAKMTPSTQSRSSKVATANTAPKKAVAKKAAKPAVPKPTSTSPKVLKKIRELQLQREAGKDIGFRPTMVRPPGAAEPIWEKEPLKDRIGLFVRDAYWMHASWDITRGAIERARSAMAEQWHGARPVLRLLRLDDSGVSSASETVERDIEIHGGLRNWYIPWTGEAGNFRVLVGYLSNSGRFHAIAKSNTVRTPAAGSNDEVDEHWSDVAAESERIFGLSGGYDGERDTGELKEILEERLHRSLGAPALAKLGASADGPFRRRGGFHFDMEIELVVYGSTVPDGYLTLNGEPVTLRSDGTFAVRLPFPDRRQVLPAVACTRDGSQQRTIVVAVERNTKIMEPLEQERDLGE